MKTGKYILLALSIVVMLMSTACKKLGCTDPKASNYNPNATKDDGFCTYDDPAGTQTIVIGKDCALQNGIDFSKGIVECADCNASMDSTNSDVIFSVTKFLTAYPDSACWGSHLLRIISLGALNDFGAIYNKPDTNATGWGKEAAPAIGHGYVVQTREGKLARFYLSNLVQEAVTGAVVGADIKFQYPWE